MQYIELYDYLLMPLYLIFFYFIINLKSKKYIGTHLRRYCITGFFLHMMGSFLYCMVIQYYYGYGDSFGFFQGSNFIRDVIRSTGDPFSPFFMSSNDFARVVADIADPNISLPTGIEVVSNLTTMKISAFLSYFSFNSYIVISLFFGLFSFIGLWKLYCVLNEITQKKEERFLAIAILYTPSIWFWGGGLIKDSVCVGTIGLIVYYLHKFLVKKKMRPKDPFIFLISFYLLFAIKNYLAGALIASTVFAYMLHVTVKSKNSLLKFATVIVAFSIVISIIALSLSSIMDSILEDYKSNIELFKGAYANANIEDERSMASFTNTTVNSDFSDLIINSPVAIFTTLFRPFIWETKKPLMVFSALESLFLILTTIYLLIKCRVWKFFYYILRDPYIFFCFIFVIILGVIIGFTTFNFGTLVRYRLPVLPFYFFMLLAIYIKTKEARVLKK